MVARSLIAGIIASVIIIAILFAAVFGLGLLNTTPPVSNASSSAGVNASTTTTIAQPTATAQATATSTPTAAASPSTKSPQGALLPTTVSPESNADTWLLVGIPIHRGDAVNVFVELNSPTEHKNICGAVNYYIDDHAAGGQWHINEGDACQAISGWLHLDGADTTKLTLGTHTLKIDYLGNSTYAPSQFVEQFTVV
ncbi:MAG: hypothetical protein ACXW1F_06945 [Halobacteriota archaeon]